MDPSSGRPKTGRPTTGRPTTGTPGKRGGTAAGRPTTRGAGAADEQQYCIEEEWDEDYESEDDGDVFAFVPPDLGPAPELQQNPLNPSVDAQNAAAAHPSQSQANDGVQSGDDDTYYYDEATGAVYDSQGRLVDMPPEFEPASLMEDQQRNSLPLSHARALRDETMSDDRNSPMSGTTTDEGAAPIQNAAYRDQIRGAPHIEQLAPCSSTENRSYDSNSSTSKDVSAQALTHARSYGAFPSMDTLPEVDSLPASRGSDYRRASLLHGTRDLGTTANGSISPDANVPVHGVRPGTGGQHSNRGPPPFDSQMEMRDLRHSPDSDIKYPLDSGDYTFQDEVKLHRISIGDELGMGDGMVHPHMDGIEVSSHGMRMVELEMEMEEDSPYPEVRASVSNIDDPDMPVGTLRMWFISFSLTIIAAGGNMFFSLRYPAPSFSPIIVLLVAYPMGKLLAAIMPIRTFTAPRWMGGFEWSLNPGVYNIKEHAVTTIMSGIAINQAYAFNVLIVQDSPLYYNEPKGIGFSIMFVLCSQTIGFGLAGMCQRFLVWPASMIWPQNLVAATILNTLHAEEDGADDTMTRFRFFAWACGGAFVWYFVPGFLFQALSVFNWVCWIWPENIPVNVVFGVATGLGASVLTFDWTQIVWVGSPLVTPWWAECNIFAGFAVVFWIIAPIMYFTNAWYQSYLPMNSSASWDRFGNPYEISRVILNGRDLDRDAYEAYSPLYLSTTLTLVYFVGFATMTAVLVHTVLYHGKSMYKGIKNIKTEEDDIHAKFMRTYRETPDWWYAVILLIAFSLSVMLVEIWDTGMPVWALLVSVMIPLVYILPSGFVYAMTGQVIGTNLLAEFAAGYLMPGKPLPNMIFKAFALQGLLGGLQFVQDLKLGHYMKVPPRLTFWAQVSGTLVACFVQVGVKEWMFSNIPEICQPSEPHKFTCPHINVFYTASLIWGAIGPNRMFGHGSIYRPIYWAMLFGALAPIPFWLLARRFPRSWVRYVSWPVILTGTSYIPPAAGINISSWFAVGFIFQFLIRRYNFRWWSKYNFVLAASMDAGTILSALVIFFALNLPKNGGLFLNWWGNTVFLKTVDAQGMPYKMPPQEGFGSLPRY